MVIVRTLTSRCLCLVFPEPEKDVRIHWGAWRWLRRPRYCEVFCFFGFLGLRRFGKGIALLAPLSMFFSDSLLSVFCWLTRLRHPFLLLLFLDIFSLVTLVNASCWLVFVQPGKRHFEAYLLDLASVLTESWHLKVNWGHLCGKDAHFLMTTTSYLPFA